MASNNDTPSNVADFYNGKSVLITGGAGYVGEVIMEVLLRCCPGIQSVFILLREKKGKKPDDRKEILLNRTIFQKLRESQPDALEKVHAVAGDVSQPDLGMNQEDLLKLTREVSIVFHCAAELSFTKPVRLLLTQNAMGTNNVIELCRKLNKVEALIFTSTVCSNSNRKTEIQEEVYRLPFPAQRFVDELKNGNDESLEKLVDECLPVWPNPYCFSKHVAENILQDNAKGIPVAIIRPSLVITVWKDPVPGYSEKNSAMALLALGVGHGFVKVVLGDPDIIIDMVPADVVANIHILSAWRVATGRSSSPFVVNCTSYGVLFNTWKEMTNSLLGMFKAIPFPRAFRTVTGYRMIKNKVLYRINTIFEHYIPAMAMDAILRSAGKKPRLVSMYRKYDKAMDATYFYTTQSWAYETEHLKLLDKDLDQEDRKVFYTDLSGLDLYDIGKSLGTGFPDFDWAKDKRTMPERRKIAHQRHMLTISIKYAAMLCVCAMFYLVISLILQITNVL